MAHENEERSTGASPARSNSSNTLEGEREKPGDKEQQDNGGDTGEEEKNDDTPKPVGFFDPSLHKVRIEVAWKWVVTSKFTLARKTMQETDRC